MREEGLHLEIKICGDQHITSSSSTQRLPLLPCRVHDKEIAQRRSSPYSRREGLPIGNDYAFEECCLSGSVRTSKKIPPNSEARLCPYLPDEHVRTIAPGHAVDSLDFGIVLMNRHSRRMSSPVRCGFWLPAGSRVRRRRRVKPRRGNNTRMVLPGWHRPHVRQC